MEQQQTEREIHWLEQQLEAKKRELAARGETKEEREIIREIVQEMAAEKIAPPVPAISAVSDDDTKVHALEKEHKHIVAELVERAISHGIASAMNVARSMKNPHILDDFHDTLADHYYEKLVEARKLKT